MVLAVPAGLVTFAVTTNCGPDSNAICRVGSVKVRVPPVKEIGLPIDNNVEKLLPDDSKLGMVSAASVVMFSLCSSVYSVCQYFTLLPQGPTLPVACPEVA